ncbi:MAG TPA: Omp28-related outer membrane protein [Brumimicrobium sp.]|nr:Omp28-related outer membrane protein [Brumimicrobium sp.]
MKKIYFSIVCASLALTSISQTVAEVQTPLVVKKTATWCQPCGTWGWDLFNEIWDEVLQNSVILEMHNSSSSGLYSLDAKNLYDFHEARSSTPVFYVNTINEVEYSSSGIYPSITKTNVLNAVNTTTSLSPVVNSGFTHSITGNTLNINTKVKFFQNTTGEYYLGVYATEDNVVAQQSGRGVTTHKRIMRASAYSYTQGDLIINGAASSGDEFTATHSITLDPSWNTNNIKVFTVIWKKEGTKYEYVNAHQTAGYTSVNNFDLSGLDINLYPNVSSGNQDVFLEVNGAATERISVEVYNQVGMRINTIFNGELNSNQETFNVNPTRSLAKGIYFVNIVSEKNSKRTMKMIVG